MQERSNQVDLSGMFRYYQAELSLDFEGLEELLFVIGFGILNSDVYALRYE